MNGCQTCNDCPSKLIEETVRTLFDRTPGSPVCAQTGAILGRPGQGDSVQDSIMEHFAKDCEFYGQPRPEHKPGFAVAAVTTSDPIVFRQPNRVAPTSCTQCKHMVRADVVNDELGWTAPLCGATGRLLLGNYQSEARKCVYGDVGENRDSTENLFLDPVYDTFKMTGIRVSQAPAEFTASTEFIEPSTRETDKPVTEDWWEAGVRAWMKVTDGSGDPDRMTYLPIARRDFFSEEEQAKIPFTGQDSHPEFYIDHQNLLYDIAVEIWEQDCTPFLMGDAGTGKTQLCEHIAWLTQMPFDRVSVDAATEKDDLAGKWLFEEGETRWVDGRLTKRWRLPGVICLDEPNTGPDEVWQMIRPLTDNAKQLVLDAAKGQKVERSQLTFFVMTGNPPDNPIYIGTKEISDADGNRLSAIRMDLPPDNIEREILRRWCANDDYALPNAMLDRVMGIAKELRQLIKDGSLPVSWGIRPQIAVARKTRWYDLTKAYRRAITDRLDPAVADMILGIVTGYNA